MKEFAKIESGQVVNISVWGADAQPEGWIDVTGLGAGIGDLYDGTTFTRPLDPDPVVTVPEIISQYTGAVQQRLDDFARTRNYDGILSACTYATSAVPKFATEGQYCVTLRDASWAKCYEILDAVQAGTRPLPTLDQLLAELPAMAWPA